jgi:hypothetical protein
MFAQVRSQLARIAAIVVGGTEKGCGEIGAYFAHAAGSAVPVATG